jgi:hypothetical protein
MQRPSRMPNPVAGPSSSYTVPVTLAFTEPEGADREASPPRLPSSPVQISSPCLTPREVSLPRLPSSPIEISTPRVLAPDADV